MLYLVERVNKLCIKGTQHDIGRKDKEYHKEKLVKPSKVVVTDRLRELKVCSVCVGVMKGHMIMIANTYSKSVTGYEVVFYVTLQT